MVYIESDSTAVVCRAPAVNNATIRDKEGFKRWICLTRKKIAIPCPYCPQTCSTPWNMKIHCQRMHRRIGETIKSVAPLTSTQSASDIGSTPTSAHYYQSPNGGYFSGRDSMNSERSQSSKKRDAGKELIETMREMLEIKKMWNQLGSPSSPLEQMLRLLRLLCLLGWPLI